MRPRGDGKVRVRVNPKFYRPAEVDLLIGEAHKAPEKLGWEPKVQLEQMIRADTDIPLRDEGQG